MSTGPVEAVQPSARGPAIAWTKGLAPTALFFGVGVISSARLSYMHAMFLASTAQFAPAAAFLVPRIDAASQRTTVLAGSLVLVSSKRWA